MPKIDSKYKATFIASNQLLADGVVQEALDRESTQPITVEAYVRTRRSSVGLWPFLDLARWTFDIDLPEETLKHPVLREMEEATVDLVALANVRRKGISAPTTVVLIHSGHLFLPQGVPRGRRAQQLCHRDYEGPQCARRRRRSPSSD